VRLLSAQARAIIPAYLLPTLPNEAYALAQVMREYALVAQANARAAALNHDMQTGTTQSRYAAIFNAEYQRLMSVAMPPQKEAGPTVAWVPNTVTPGMPAAVVVPGRKTADLKPGTMIRGSLPGASKTDPSGVTAKGDEVVTTVSTPTDEAVAQAVVDEQVAAASTGWLDTTTGKVVTGAAVLYGLWWLANRYGVIGARGNRRRNPRKKYGKMHAYKWRVTYWGPSGMGRGKHEDFETERDAKNALRGMARASGLDLDELETSAFSDREIIYTNTENGADVGSISRGDHA
jgi:hypothetical protein